MSRFVVQVDWQGTRDPGTGLERARAVMTLGGSVESALEIVRPGFAALALSHQSRVPALETDGRVLLAGGHGLPDRDDDAFVGRVAAWLDGEAPAPPALRPRPLGRRALLRWDPAARELLLVAEPNGLAPLYVMAAADRALVSTEPKGIWALARAALRVDADGLVDLFTLGECVGTRTPWRGVSALPPGSALRLRADGSLRRDWYAPRFSERAGGDARAAAEAMNAALEEVLRAERAASSRATVALSGGMDSRYLLAGALRTWERVESVTFGPAGSTDVTRARAVAERCGVPNRFVPWDGSGFAAWAPYAAWRVDGMGSCLHLHGMDALITHAPPVGVVLNGMGGDILTGVFLRPGYLLRAGGADAAVATVLGRRRLHGRPLAEVFKPEVLRESRTPTAEALAEVMRPCASRRLGNALLHYWVRQHCARSTLLGPLLEAPFVDWVTPLADPRFVEAAAGLSLELRFLGRAYRRALGLLEPRFMDIACERYGLAPRWPWPVLALRGAARRLRLVRRARLPLSYTTRLRGSALPWARGLLLDRATLADGYLRPDYLRDILARHAEGRADHAPELAMALTLELWRRIFVEGREDLARPPVELPAAGRPLRSARAGLEAVSALRPGAGGEVA